MRIRFARSAKGSAGELRIKASSGERLNRAQVQWLGTCRDSVVLPCSLERAGVPWHKRERLCYRTDRRASLGAYLRLMVMDSMLMSQMLGDLLRLQELVLRAPGPALAALYDKRYVFVDDAGHLSFALVPLEGVSWGECDSPLALLHTLGDDKQIRCGSPSDVACADRLLGFVEREGKAFSLNRFRAFLEGEFWQQPSQREVNRAALLSAGTTGDAGCVLCDLGQGAEFALELGRTYTLGRGEGCDICLVQHPQVSRLHASLCCEREGVTLTDRGSTNGTFAAGKRIAAGQSVYLPWGQEFSLSGARLCAERRAHGTRNQDKPRGDAFGTRASVR